MSVKGEDDSSTEVARHLCRLGKPTQECCSSEDNDAQAEIETQNPALHRPRPSTFKAQVDHSEDDAQNCVSHFEKQGRQSGPVNVGQTVIIGILASLPCRSILHGYYFYGGEAIAFFDEEGRRILEQAISQARQTGVMAEAGANRPR